MGEVVKKLFIANRGEIACRIARTAQRLGIHTCGVFTPQDERTRHVRVLEEMTKLPSGELRENYLNQDLLVEIARSRKASAVHPGYGFLAENPEFAEKVISAGLIWVGPNPQSMRELGGKIRAKEIAAQANVPIAPWTKISEQPDEAETAAIVKQIGLPLLIKAAHGGGGRGQRVVHEASQFAEALRTARSESLRSFGSAEVFVERFLDRPRHIEVQILADQHGHVYALGERDCTLQRRNQKVVEESPAVVLDENTRRQIHESARALAAAVGYTNAGTVEFLAQQKAGGEWEYFFMELNARLQVEHPVTEMLREVDLVELQIRAAKNETIRENQLGHAPRGHAIEVRLCAENPANQFLPTPGPLTDWRVPSTPHLRIDTGFEVGDVIPQEYDSLFAKFIYHADNRDAAIDGLVRVLDQTSIAGFISNKQFLRSLLDHADFRRNATYTRWIEAHPELIPEVPESLDQDLVYWGKKLSSELLVQRRPAAFVPVFGNNDVKHPRLLKTFHPEQGEHGIHTPQGLVKFSGHFTLDDSSRAYASGWISRLEFCLSFTPAIHGISQRRIAFAGEHEVEDIRAHHGPIIAQVPGVVLEVRAKESEVVDARMPILVVEAMKIEMPMSLPVPARVTGIHVKTGDRIQPGQTLVTWEPAE